MKIKITVPGWLSASLEYDEETRSYYLDGYCRFCEDEAVRSYFDEYGFHMECLQCRQSETLIIEYEEE